MGGAVRWTRSAGISDIPVTIKPLAEATLLGVLHADKAFLVESMIDFYVVLIVGVLVRTRTDPVSVRIVSVRSDIHVRKRIVLHQLKGDRVDQIAWPRGELIGGSVQNGAPRASVGREVVEGY